MIKKMMLFLLKEEIVFVDRRDYIGKMKLILATTLKFKIIQIDDSKLLLII